MIKFFYNKQKLYIGTLSFTLVMIHAAFSRLDDGHDYLPSDKIRLLNELTAEALEIMDRRMIDDGSFNELNDKAVANYICMLPDLPQKSFATHLAPKIEHNLQNAVQNFPGIFDIDDPDNRSLMERVDYTLEFAKIRYEFYRKVRSMQNEIRIKITNEVNARLKSQKIPRWNQALHDKQVILEAHAFSEYYYMQLSMSKLLDEIGNHIPRQDWIKIFDDGLDSMDDEFLVAICTKVPEVLQCATNEQVQRYLDIVTHAIKIRKITPKADFDLVRQCFLVNSPKIAKIKKLMHEDKVFRNKILQGIEKEAGVPVIPIVKNALDEIQNAAIAADSSDTGPLHTVAEGSSNAVRQHTVAEGSSNAVRQHTVAEGSSDAVRQHTVAEGSSDAVGESQAKAYLDIQIIIMLLSVFSCIIVSMLFINHRHNNHKQESQGTVLT